MRVTERPGISLPLLFTIVCWAYNFIVLKLLYVQVPPPVVGLSRWALMLVGLYGLCAIIRVKPWVARSDLPMVLLQGFLSLGLYMVFFFEGTERTTAGEAAIVLSTAPVLTAIFAAIAGQEKLRAPVLIWAGVAFAGVVLVILGGGSGLQGKLIGDLLVLASSVVWAVAAVMSRPLVGRHHPVATLTVSMYGALPALLVYGFVPTLETRWSELTTVSWGYLFYVAFAAGVIGFAGFYMGVKKVGAPGAMLYQYFVAPLAALFQWMILKQLMTIIQIGGLAVVIVGVSMSTRARNARTLPPSAEALEGACGGK